MYKTIYDIPGGKKKKKSKARFPRDDAKFRNVARAALRQTRRADDLETSGSRRGTRIALFKFESEKCLALVAAYKSSSSLRCNARPDMHLRACQGQSHPGLLILNSATFSSSPSPPPAPPRTRLCYCRSSLVAGLTPGPGDLTLPGTHGGHF